ncbi:MAG TPA: CDP-diacylglycerol--serine O-phosphatidyltransferase [Candidatus Binataceae bacterium]|nr:CDP-diacylglycerol--serine O-phosphatidyltransferase [Candidatus Binataceae bacterium]
MNNRYRRNPRARAARLRLISELRDRRERVVAPFKRGIFLVPVTITSLGLLAGFYSLISSINGHFVRAAVMIAFAFICDGLDGRVARLSRTSSPFGVEYDSLTDVVAFGVAPAVLAYTWALKPLRLVGVIIAGLYVVFAAFRLARFNVQTGSVDKRRFVGLPVPGAAAMIAGLVFAYHYFYLDAPQMLVAVIAPLTAALGILMISRVPYPSFKSIDFYHRAPLAVTATVMVVLTCLVAVPQVTACVLATAYVLSGPFLMLAGEQMTAKMPVLRPSEPVAQKARETSPLSSQQG